MNNTGFELIFPLFILIVAILIPLIALRFLEKGKKKAFTKRNISIYIFIFAWMIFLTLYLKTR